MKKLLLIAIALLAAGALYSGQAQAGIVGTAHDLSSAGSSSYKGAVNQVCSYCHVPHNATGSAVPLWSHATTAATFTMYPSGGTIQGTIDTTPNVISKACLSCHDGVTAVTGTTVMTGSKAIGTNLSNDHPISITYNTTLDTGLKASPSTVVLYNNKVECASCHNAHDNATAGKFLRATTVGSAICVLCHSK